MIENLTLTSEIEHGKKPIWINNQSVIGLAKCLKYNGRAASVLVEDSSIEKRIKCKKLPVAGIDPKKASKSASHKN